MPATLAACLPASKGDRLAQRRLRFRDMVHLPADSTTYLSSNGSCEEILFSASAGSVLEMPYRIEQWLCHPNRPVQSTVKADVNSYHTANIAVLEEYGRATLASVSIYRIVKEVLVRSSDAVSVKPLGPNWRRSLRALVQRVARRIDQHVAEPFV